MGESSRKAGTDFEKEIEATFEQYHSAHIAQLDFYPVPMRPTGLRHPKTGGPMFAPKKAAPFDVCGWSMIDGRIIAAELKSSKRKTSITIVGDGKEGSGIQWHQLTALYNVAQAGGIARLVWSNEGEVGVLDGVSIANAWYAANDAFNLENNFLRGGKRAKAPVGAKSIKWEKFTAVEYKQIKIGDTPVLEWIGI